MAAEVDATSSAGGARASPAAEARPKKPSGSEYRKRRAARQRREAELRLELLKLTGKTIEQTRVDWKPWPHARRVLDGYKAGYRWQAHVWHRRASKTSTALALIAEAAKDRVGTYWHLLPKLVQGETVVWNSRRSDGIRELDVHFPPEIRAHTNHNDMRIELINGSLFQVMGSDSFDRRVGANVHGIVFDEWARANPLAWDYLSPILVADPKKKAWAVFISTYLGRNHWFRMFERVKSNPEWLTSNLTIDDTTRHDGKPIVSKADVEAERASGKSEELLRQEYYNDPLAALDGAFYSQAMRGMINSGRVGPLLYDPSLPVTASIDLGFADLLVFVFWQSCGNEERVIGSRAWQFTRLTGALDDIRASFPWGRRPMTAVVPHDGRFGAAEVLGNYGYETVVLNRTSSIPQEIDNARAFLDRVRIDNAVRAWTDNEENNARLIEALQGYRTERSKLDAETHQKNAAYTWHAHWADAVRYYVTHRGRHSELGGGGWGPAPNYKWQDRAVIGGAYV